MAPVIRSHQELCGAGTLSKFSMGGPQNDVKLLGDGSGARGSSLTDRFRYEFRELPHIVSSGVEGAHPAHD